MADDVAPEAVDLRPAAGVAGFETSWPALFSTAYKVAFRILGDRAEAEDVAQGAVAKAWLRWDRVGGYAAAWVATVSANAALSHVRRDAVLRRLPLARPGTAMPPGELRCDLVRAVRRLSGRQREVFVLLYVAELRVEQVAARLGCTAGSVKQHAARARQSVRADLQLDDGEGG